VAIQNSNTKQAGMSLHLDLLTNQAANLSLSATDRPYSKTPVLIDAFDFTSAEVDDPRFIISALGLCT